MWTSPWAAKHTIISCERLISNEEIRRAPEKNTLTGLCIDAVVPMAYGAHPSQVYGCYDYDSAFYWEYDRVSRNQETFDQFLEDWLSSCPDHDHYLDRLGASRLLGLRVQEGYGYAVGLKRK